MYKIMYSWTYSIQYLQYAILVGVQRETENGVCIYIYRERETGVCICTIYM